MYTCILQRGQPAFSEPLNSFFSSTNCCSFTRLHSREDSPPLHTLHLHQPSSLLLPFSSLHPIPHISFHPNYGASHMHCFNGSALVLSTPSTHTHSLFPLLLNPNTLKRSRFHRRSIHLLHNTPLFERFYTSSLPHLHTSLSRALCVIAWRMLKDGLSVRSYPL